MLLQFILLQANTGSKGSGLISMIPLVLIIIIFYFTMIRPQMKKQKEAKKFIENVNKGDKIVTIGGIFGKIVEVRDNSYIIEVEGGNRLRILKTAVSMENSAALQSSDTSVSTPH